VPLAPTLPPDAAPSGAVLAAAAHLRLSTDTLGDIALHLRLRDGAAHVRLEADAHGALQARAPELSRALAAEGIAVGRLDVEPRAAPAAPAAQAQDAFTQSGGGEGRQHPRDDRAPEDPAPPQATQPRARRVRRAGHDVTA
jgi:flagellar hook-length control protein FliK